MTNNCKQPAKVKTRLYWYIAQECLIQMRSYSGERESNLVDLIKMEINRYDQKWGMFYCGERGEHIKYLKKAGTCTGVPYDNLSHLIRTSRQEIINRITRTVDRYLRGFIQ